MKFILVAISLVLMSTAMAAEYCYAPYGQPVIATHYVDHAVIKVNWLDQDTGEEAWSEWTIDEEQKLSTCEIWVKRPMQPLGDPDMDALGHEVLHCFIGNFHDE